MKSTLHSTPISFKTSLIFCLIFALAACTDSKYTAPGDDPVVVIVQPPEAPEALSVVVSGVVLESGTTNTIADASLSFFEGGQAASNIIDISSGESIATVVAENGTFQVAAENTDEFTVKVSAEGYFDKLANVSIADNAQIVQVVVELLSNQIDAVGSDFVEQQITGSTVDTEISLSSDDDSAAEDTTEGKGEVVIPAGIQFVDEQNNPIDVSSVKLEVTYMESQKAETAEEESVSIAELIPEGLNSDSSVDEVLVPIGLTEVTLTDETGSPIKNFSGDITVTIFLPDTTIDPSTGNAITQSSNLRVRTFDTETLTWTTEPESAVTIRPKDSDNLFPVDITVNHLTIFALTAEVSACTNDVTFDLTGDAVPQSGLDLVIETGDLKKTFSIPSAATELKILANDVKAAGIMQDVDSYSIYVENALGDSWLVENSSEPEVVEPSVETDITVPQSAAATQHVYVSEAELSADGTQITMTLSYLADVANTTGVGFTANFDSSVLSFNEVTDVFAGAIASGELSQTGDSLSFGWASLFGQFPGSTTAVLAKVTFDIAEGASGTSSLSLVETSSAATHTLVLQSQNLTFDPGSEGSDGIELCVDEAIVVELENPVQDNSNLISEGLSLYLQCSNDETVRTPLANAVVSYTSDANPLPTVAAETAATYQLVDLDSSASYSISVNTRTDAGVLEFTDLQLDGVDEERSIEVSCSAVTGTGTGSS